MSLDDLYKTKIQTPQYKNGNIEATKYLERLDCGKKSITTKRDNS